MKKRLLSLAGLLLLYVTALCQPHYFRHYQVENGLSHNTVFCTVQDKKGFLWFGTKDGLNRFDGYRFKRFDIQREKKGTLKSDLILSLAVDANETLWVGTQKGLYYLDAKKERFISFLDTLNGINDLFFDSKGQLWFIADNTLNRYNFQSKKTTTFPADWFFSATSICETADGTMWFATSNGYLQQFDEKTQSFRSYNVFRLSPPAESNVIQKIAFDRKRGVLVIGTNNQGIKEFDLQKRTYRDVLTHNPDKTTIYVRDILLVNEAETWFATESGVFIMDNSTGQFQNLKKKTLDPYSLSDNAVYTLYKDTEGGIWAGTFFGGLSYYPKQHGVFQKYFPDYSRNSISGNAVREICADGAGNLWIGTEDAGLNKLDPKTGMVTHFTPTGHPQSISYYNIHGLLPSGDELWIGTFEHGLDVLDIRTGKVKKHYMAGPGENQLKNNFIVSLLRTKKGDIYLGTAWGLYRYNRQQDNFTYLKDIADGSFIPCLLEDHEGTIWIATHNRGLYYFNPSTGAKGHFRNEPGNEKSLTNNSVNAIFEDSYKNLWFATESGGLCRFDRKGQRFVSYTVKNGLPSNFVFKVLEDDNKTLWVTTSKGLVNLDPANGKTTVYTKSNGLLNDQFNYNSGYRDKEGNLYFGSVQGLVKFNPAGFHRNQFIPPVYITGFQVQNKDIDVSVDSSILQKSTLYTQTITLPYDQSSFSIDFAALSFTSPETTTYSYIMKGLDKDWTYLPSNRKVYFTNLKPGTYTFIVKAGSSGVWNTPQQLTIVITPPFWATYWAYLFYAAFVISLVYYLIRTYHDIQENKKEKEIYQAKIEFFTNIAHEIKTPLTLIKGPVENLNELTHQHPEIREEVSTMERNTNRLINLINQILDFRQTEAKEFSLDFSEVNLNSLLQESYLTFKPLANKKSIRYHLVLPPAEIVLQADAEALTKVFDNLFSNAVKYAKEEVRARLLPAVLGDNKIVIEVSNDGFIIPAVLREKIFEPFFRIKETNKQKGTGLGLALARSLVELHNGKIYVKESLADSNVFVVELPYLSAPKTRKVPVQNTQRIA